MESYITTVRRMSMIDLYRDDMDEQDSKESSVEVMDMPNTDGSSSVVVGKEPGINCYSIKPDLSASGVRYAAMEQA